MLTMTLTEQDIDDLRNVVGTVKVMTAEGVELIANPDDFTQAIWTTLDTGSYVTMEMEIVGQHNVVDVTITKEA